MVSGGTLLKFPSHVAPARLSRHHTDPGPALVFEVIAVDDTEDEPQHDFMEVF